MKPNPYKLLVEGAEDLRVIPELAESHGVQWEQDQRRYVEICDCKGLENIRKSHFISAQFKASGVEALGVIIDADRYAPANSISVSKLLVECRKAIPTFSPFVNPNGLVVTDEKTRQRLGVWIMPDNRGPGMLEDLLLTLAPSDRASLVEHAREATIQAKGQHNAPFIDAHEQKAVLYSWLAWQNPPGRQLHQAIKEKVLFSRSPASDAFMDWFLRLFPSR